MTNEQKTADIGERDRALLTFGAKLALETRTDPNYAADFVAQFASALDQARDRIEREPVVKPVAPVDVYKVLKKWADGGSLDVLHISAISRDVATALASAPERVEADPDGFLDRETGSLRHIVPASDLSRYVPLYASPTAPVVTDEMHAAIIDMRDAVAFLDKRNASSDEDKIAVGSDHWTWLEKAARKVAALASREAT